ncbi:unnamed protein product, partial [Urochloa humidicola]
GFNTLDAPSGDVDRLPSPALTNRTEDLIEAIDEALSETASLPERNIEPTTQETPASVDEHTLLASN